MTENDLTVLEERLLNLVQEIGAGGLTAGGLLMEDDK